MTPAANPEIYGKDITETSLPEVSKNLKEKTKELHDYRAILQDLEKNVILKQVEIEKQKLRNIAYATNANRGAKPDYTKLANYLKTKSGYLAPKKAEDKVFYDIAFRLKELGFAQNIDLSQKVEYNDKLAREIIAFQKLAQLKGQEGVVGPETLKALMKSAVTASTILGSESGAVTNSVNTINPTGNVYHTKKEENQSGVKIENEGGGVPVTDFDDVKENKKTQGPDAIIKKFEVATTLSNSMDNITKGELKIFRKLDNKVNKNDMLYMEFEQGVVQNLQKIYSEKGKNKSFANKGMQDPGGDMPENVSELLRNYSEGYLEGNAEEQKEIELDPNFFFAFRDTIVEFLFDSERTKEQKQWVILFVRSFTNNFNDILQSCEAELRKSALSMVTPKYLSLK